MAKLKVEQIESIIHIIMATLDDKSIRHKWSVPITSQTSLKIQEYTERLIKRL